MTINISRRLWICATYTSIYQLKCVCVCVKSVLRNFFFIFIVIWILLLFINPLTSRSHFHFSRQMWKKSRNLTMLRIDKSPDDRMNLGIFDVYKIEHRSDEIQLDSTRLYYEFQWDFIWQWNFKTQRHQFVRLFNKKRTSKMLTAFFFIFNGFLGQAKSDVTSVKVQPFLLFFCIF